MPMSGQTAKTNALARSIRPFIDAHVILDIIQQVVKKHSVIVIMHVLQILHVPAHHHSVVMQDIIKMAVHAPNAPMVAHQTKAQPI